MPSIFSLSKLPTTILIVLMVIVPGTLPIQTDVNRYETDKVIQFRNGEAKLLRWSYKFHGDEKSLLQDFSCGYHNDRGVYIPLAVDLAGEYLEAKWIDWVYLFIQGNQGFGGLSYYDVSRN